MKGAGEARERILRAAEELFLGHGFGRVTMDELAAELRMSKKTLYQHFASKEELCAAVLERAFVVIDAELGRVLGEEGLDFAERLTRFVRVVAARFEGAGPFLRDLRREAPALYEMKIALGSLLAAHRFTIAEDRPVPPTRRNVAFGPRGGVRLIYQGAAAVTKAVA